MSAKAKKLSDDELRIASSQNSVRLLKASFNADTLFSFAVISRSAMAQGNGLSFDQVKAIIDDEFKPPAPVEPREFYPMPWE